MFDNMLQTVPTGFHEKSKLPFSLISLTFVFPSKNRDLSRRNRSRTGVVRQTLIYIDIDKDRDTNDTLSFKFQRRAYLRLG